jgi:hypothetical protein
MFRLLLEGTQQEKDSRPVPIVGKKERNRQHQEARALSLSSLSHPSLSHPSLSLYFLRCFSHGLDAWCSTDGTIQNHLSAIHHPSIHHITSHHNATKKPSNQTSEPSQANSDKRKCRTGGTRPGHPSISHAPACLIGIVNRRVKIKRNMHTAVVNNTLNIQAHLHRQ